MFLIYLSIFLIFWSIIVGSKIKLNNFIYFLVFLVLVIAKTFIDINALPDLPHYFAGAQELSNVKWWDVPTYNLTFLKCPEIGFRYILRIGGWLGDFKWSLLLISIIHTFAYINLAKKYSPYVFVSLCMFLIGDCLQSFFVLRQHLAIAFVILSYPYIIKRDFKKFVIFMILAFSCHQTALVFVPIYFIYGIREKRKLNVLFIIIFIILSVSFSLIFNYFATSLVGYESYMESRDGNLTTFFISMCYLFTYVYFLRNDVYIDGIYRLVYILLVLNFIIMVAGYSFGGINRLMMYYTVGNILAVPLTMKHIKYPLIRYGYCCIVLSMLVLVLFYGSNSEYLILI